MNLIRIGDDTDRGGKVETGLQTLQFDGRHVARKMAQYAGDMQAKGVIDTILNRVASGRLDPGQRHFGSTVSAVVNQYNQFSDVNGPIARDQHHRSPVEQIPVSQISQRVNDLVDSYLRDGCG
ncbi:hypothetical protein C6Q13_00145 [Burkholderia gladioli]|nr:hypothetical protein C6Q13_00145 [Burkholderia gladioli]